MARFTSKARPRTPDDFTEGGLIAARSELWGSHALKVRDPGSTESALPAAGRRREGRHLCQDRVRDSSSGVRKGSPDSFDSKDCRVDLGVPDMSLDRGRRSRLRQPGAGRGPGRRCRTGVLVAGHRTSRPGGPGHRLRPPPPPARSRRPAGSGQGRAVRDSPMFEYHARQTCRWAPARNEADDAY